MLEYEDGAVVFNVYRVARVVELRRELLAAGHDAGAHSIAYHLVGRVEKVPALVTIWRILCRNDLITPEPHKRPRSSFKRFEAQLPNEMWQADSTHWQLADASDVEIFNLIDDHSRLILASVSGREWVIGNSDGSVTDFSVSPDGSMATYARRGNGSGRPDEIWVASLLDGSTQRVFQKLSAPAALPIYFAPNLDITEAVIQTLKDLVASGDPASGFEACWRAVQPDDVLTLIYTSGTTGPPKGVEITHAQMLAELTATNTLIPVGVGDRSLKIGLK